MNQQQTGFTLIELIVVIVILGILAATALPRFSNLSTEARIATVRGIEGAVRSAAAIVHAQSLAEGDASVDTVTLEGVTVATRFLYPNTATGIGAAVELAGSNVSQAAGLFQRDDAPTPGTCSVTYTEPATANASPGVNVQTGGC